MTLRWKAALLVVLLVGLVSGCGNGADTSATESPDAEATASESEAAASEEPEPPEQPSVALADVGFTLASMPLRLADHLGYFEEEGLDVEFVTFANTTAGLSALQSGEVQFGVTGLQAVIQSVSQGGELIQVVNIASVPSISLLVGKDHPGMKSITDIADFDIGVSSLGASTDVLVRVLFERNGLDPNTAKVAPVGLGATGYAAITSGQVQAIVQNDPTTTRLVESGEAYLLYDTRTLEGTEEVYGGPMPGNGASTTRSFLEENPNTVNAFGRAIARTLEYIQNASPEEIVELLPQADYYPDGDKELFTKIIAGSTDMYAGNGTTNPDAPATMVRTLEIADPAADFSALDLDGLYYNGWAEE